MTTSAKIITDSISDLQIRITTMELSYPLIVHAEFMTHRMFSRNAASNRAIPTSKIIDQVEIDAFYPDYWGKNHTEGVTHIDKYKNYWSGNLRGWIQYRQLI